MLDIQGLKSRSMVANNDVAHHNGASLSLIRKVSEFNDDLLLCISLHEKANRLCKEAFVAFHAVLRFSPDKRYKPEILGQMMAALPYEPWRRTWSNLGVQSSSQYETMKGVLDSIRDFPWSGSDRRRIRKAILEKTVEFENVFGSAVFLKDLCLGAECIELKKKVDEALALWDAEHE